MYQPLADLLRPQTLDEVFGQEHILGKHQGGSVNIGDDIRHRIGLTRAGNTQKHLLLLALSQTLGEPLNGFRLVAGWLIF